MKADTTASAIFVKVDLRFCLGLLTSDDRFLDTVMGCANDFLLLLDFITGLCSSSSPLLDPKKLAKALLLLTWVDNLRLAAGEANISSIVDMAERG